MDDEKILGAGVSKKEGKNVITIFKEPGELPTIKVKRTELKKQNNSVVGR